MIITADWHLTDAPADAYRWQVFAALRKEVKKRKPREIYVLGDLGDRKDRHSAELVTKLVEELVQLRAVLQEQQSDDYESTIHIIMGNHDEPLKGSPYWSFLQHLPGIEFYTEPTELIEDNGNRLLLLPYSPTPAAAWAAFKMESYSVIFIHQAVSGVIENGITISNPTMPLFPRNALVYAGDIHTHQKVGPVQYIGAPHPVKFGDDYECRMLVLHEADYSIADVIELHPLRKHMFDIASIAELNALRTKPGDQARIRFSVPLERMAYWPAEREQIGAWGKARGIELASVEAIVEASAPMPAVDGEAAPDLYSDPALVLASFTTSEGIGAELHATGAKLLQSCLADQQSA